MKDAHDEPFIRTAGDPELMVYPHGRDEPGVEWPHGRLEVAIKHRGLELRLFYADKSSEADPVEIRLLPDGSETLDPKVLRSFAPQTELYLASARAAIRWRQEDLYGAIEALRAVGKPGRGHGDPFYRAIAEHYNALVAEGERYPVKTLGEIHHVTISAASRWLKEARRRGYLEANGG
jgi:hypothetical protein